jgi:diadenosine tetraphosphatase ApaH/serine/threonine PP2A family protein phosphatase
LAILSDVHGNRPALETVLDEIDSSSPDELWCLGDVVGYGAQPDDCARLVRERCSLCLVGNHDLAVIDQINISAFSPTAAAAVEWTQENSSAETLEFLRGLEPLDESREVALYHASPRDPVWEYVLWPDQAGECMDAQARRVSFVGHSHVALFFTRPEDPEEGGNGSSVQARGAQAGPGTTIDLRADRWLINPGSVGQPRDGDPRAAWLELDTEAWTATYHRVRYDIDTAAEAIEAAGLPSQLARRLYLGQ